MLDLPNFSKSFELEIDVSNFSMCIVLMQDKCLIAYFSQPLSI